MTNDNNSPPAFPTDPVNYPRGYGDEGEIIRVKQQAIFASYRLNCCGNITEWGMDVDSGAFSGARDRRGTYSLDFQVWRPSPTVDDTTGTGCYSLVGNNRFTSIPSITSPGVAVVTPSPQDYIQFQPGDVLGVYVESVSETTDGIVVLTRSTFTSDLVWSASDLVWYASITPSMTNSRNGACPYSAGSSGVLNSFLQGAPVISISTGKGSRA